MTTVIVFVMTLSLLPANLVTVDREMALIGQPIVVFASDGSVHQRDARGASSQLGPLDQRDDRRPSYWGLEFPRGRL